MPDNLVKYLVIALFAGGLVLVAVRLFSPADQQGQVDVAVLPAFSEVALAGQQAFTANCAACHGAKAGGTEQGPPLVHDIYNPGHHPDEAFYRAAAQGVPQHHWPFGAMPAQPQVSRDEVETIVRYIRELQMANGIEYQPHRM